MEWKCILYYKRARYEMRESVSDFERAPNQDSCAILPWYFDGSEGFSEVTKKSKSAESTLCKRFYEFMCS